MADLIVTRPKKLGTFTLKNVQEESISNFLTNRERCLVYEKIGNQIVVLRNRDYKQRLKKKYLSSSHFLLKFEAYSGLIKDIQNLGKEIEKITFETNEEMSKIKPTFNEKIKFYEDQIVYGELKKENNKDYPVMKKEADVQLNNLLLDVFDDEKWLKETCKTMDYEKEKTKYEMEIEKQIESSKLLVDKYKNLKSISDNEEVEKCLIEGKGFISKLEKLQNYIFEINEKGNIVESEYIIIDEINEKIDELLNFFEEFKKFFIKTYELNIVVNSNIKAIELISRIWNEKIKVEVEEAAEPFLKGIHGFYTKKLNSAQDRLKVEKSRDTICHMQSGVKCLNKDMDNIKDNINNLKIVGGFKVESSGISHDIKLEKNSTPLTPFSIEDVPTSLSSELAELYRREIKKRLDLVNEEMALLAKYRAELKILEDSLKETEASPIVKTRNKFEELEKVQKSYLNLKTFINRVVIELSPESLYSVFGILMQNLSIRVSKFWGRGNEYNSTEINPYEIYKTVLHKLKKRKHPKASCACFCGTFICCGGMKTIFDQNTLKFEDIISILFKNKFLGSLKNSNGQAQQKIWDFRSEDVNDSLFKTIKGCLGVVIWFEMFKLKINPGFYLQKIQEVQDRHSHLLKNYKYIGLTKDLVTLKFN